MCYSISGSTDRPAASKIYCCNFILLIVIGIMISCLTACEKTIDIELPPTESELVVECYLAKGFPYLLSLSETVPYFDLINLPTVDSAVVQIEHNGTTITLQYIDSLGIYFSGLNVNNNDTLPYILHIEDTLRHRSLSAQAHFLPIVPIDTIIYFLNDSLDASLLTYFDDPPNKDNFYKIHFSKQNSFDTDSIRTWSFSDIIFADQNTVIGMGYRYHLGDKVRVRLFNISKAYYDFLETTERAADAAAGPFSRPTRIIDNIEGGTGIFTTLSFDEKIISITQ